MCQTRGVFHEIFKRRDPNFQTLDEVFHLISKCIKHQRECLIHLFSRPELLMSLRTGF